MSVDVYLIPGLGADERVFKKLRLPQAKVKVIKWIEPERNESLRKYSARLLDQVTNPESAVVIGVSFGGMIAVEWSKVFRFKKVIIISSEKTSKAIPALLKFSVKTGLLKIIPSALFNRPNDLIYWFFGVKSAESKQLLKDIIKDSDPDFVRWALMAIGKWNNHDPADNIISVHGDADRVLPWSNPDFTISGGGHFMIVDRAQELSDIIEEIIM